MEGFSIIPPLIWIEWFRPTPHTGLQFSYVCPYDLIGQAPGLRDEASHQHAWRFSMGVGLYLYRMCTIPRGDPRMVPKEYQSHMVRTVLTGTKKLYWRRTLPVKKPCLALRDLNCEDPPRPHMRRGMCGFEYTTLTAKRFRAPRSIEKSNAMLRRYGTRGGGGRAQSIGDHGWCQIGRCPAGPEAGHHGLRRRAAALRARLMTSSLEDLRGPGYPIRPGQGGRCALRTSAAWKYSMANYPTPWFQNTFQLPF